MKKPEPKQPSDLQHPKGDYVAWNGDVRRRGSTRWNGAADMEDQGFATRGLVTVTYADGAPLKQHPKHKQHIHAVKPSKDGRMGYQRPPKQQQQQP